MLDAEPSGAEIADPIEMESWKRRIIMWFGRAIRHGLSFIIARYSEVGDPPVFSAAPFPWIKEIERNWQTIRGEADVVMRRKVDIPSLVKISPDHDGIADEKWKSFFLWGYGYRIDENCARCPESAALLAQVPGLVSAFFSIMEPRGRLTPHRGVTKAFFTAHIGLRVPKDWERCWMIVDGQKLHWRDGESLIFDDTFEHEVLNDTPEDRVILLLHVTRPVRFPGSLVSDFCLWALRKSPFIQDALKNLEAWNAKRKA